VAFDDGFRGGEELVGTLQRQAARGQGPRSDSGSPPLRCSSASIPRSWPARSPITSRRCPPRRSSEYTAMREAVRRTVREGLQLRPVRVVGEGREPGLRAAVFDDGCASIEAIHSQAKKRMPPYTRARPSPASLLAPFQRAPEIDFYAVTVGPGLPPLPCGEPLNPPLRSAERGRSGGGFVIG
jgi:hypothetical protein